MLSMVAAIALAAAVPASAGPGDAGDSETQPGSMQSGSRRTGGAGRQAGQQDEAATAYLAAAGAQGEITSIDKQRGRVSIKTDDGDQLTVQVPPAVAQQFNEGDAVQVATQMTLAERAGGGQAGTTGSGATGRSPTTGSGGANQPDGSNQPDTGGTR